MKIYFCPADEAYLARCREAGIARGLFGVPSTGRDAALEALDGYARLLD